MDIEYLLVLQNARLSLPDFIGTLLEGVSYIADGPGLVALALVLYWCVDKRMGLFSAFAMATGNFVSQLLKNIVCVYRPWVRDARIVPAEAAIEGAGGYSFPSGHTTGAGTVFGSIAWLTRKKHRVMCALCVVAVLLVGFSRNFLGVHTPQDVLVGLVVAVASIACVQAFFNWIDRYDALMPGHRRDVAVVVVVIVACAASLAVVALKPYPLDYVDGQLLVDPEQMMKGSFEAVGLLGGLALAWCLERRFVSFSTEGLAVRTRVVRGVVGVAIVGVVYVATDVAFKAVLPYVWAKLCAYFLVVFFAVFVAPLVFTALEKRADRTRAQADDAAKR